VILSRQPKLLMPAIMVIFVLAGLAAPVPVAVVCLVLLAIFVGWLGFLSWPVLDSRGRTMRALVLIVIVGVAVARITGLLD
jgi:chromate transport protein ChrA